MLSSSSKKLLAPSSPSTWSQPIFPTFHLLLRPSDISAPYQYPPLSKTKQRKRQSILQKKRMRHSSKDSTTPSLQVLSSRSQWGMGEYHPGPPLQRLEIGKAWVTEDKGPTAFSLIASSSKISPFLNTVHLGDPGGTWAAQLERHSLPIY